jgi:hypothetical protein
MTSDEAGSWHREAISASTGKTLRALSEAKLLDRFYLAGGTGLALRLGHRLSLDLDFFAPEPFEEEIVLQQAQKLPGFALVTKGPQTLHTTIQGTKVSFLGYAYPLLFPLTQFLDVQVADARDIACMKLSAIAGRGTRRDFVDLYVCAREFGPGELLQLFDRKYSQTRYNRLHVLKSLTFFADAEKDPMPNMLAPLDWEELKRYFQWEVSRLA